MFDAMRQQNQEHTTERYRRHDYVFFHCGACAFASTQQLRQYRRFQRMPDDGRRVVYRAFLIRNYRAGTPLRGAANGSFDNVTRARRACHLTLSVQRWHASHAKSCSKHYLLSAGQHDDVRCKLPCALHFYKRAAAYKRHQHSDKSLHMPPERRRVFGIISGQLSLPAPAQRHRNETCTYHRPMEPAHKGN